MDVKNITSQDGYERENVKDERHKAFLLGYDNAIKVLESIYYDFETENDDSLLDKIIAEQAGKVLNKVKETLELSMLECQIAFIDDEIANSSSDKENLDDCFC